MRLSCCWPLMCCLIVGCATPESGHLAPLRYAKLLRMHDEAHFTSVEIINPWDTLQTLSRYALVPRTLFSANDTQKAQPFPQISQQAAEKVQKGTQKAQEGTRTLQERQAAAQALRDFLKKHPDAQVIHVPLERTLPQSTVHAALALQLGAQHALAGLCDTAFIVAPALKHLHLPNFGRGDQPDVERILAAKIDGCLLAPFENTRYESLQRMNITVIDAADYMEQTPLGRAEWMRFYGRLWGKATVADSMFDAEAQRYEQLRHQLHSAQENRAPQQPLLDLPWQGTWYMPEGFSYMASLIIDAGGSYPRQANHKRTGSAALSLEQALDRAQHCSLWVIKTGDDAPQNLRQLAARSPHFRHFPSVKAQRVWVCNTLSVPYYEHSPFAPTTLLRDWGIMLGTLPKQGDPVPHYFKLLPP